MFPSPQPNAFATGASPNKALVAVRTGQLGSMRQDEVEAVLGHEIGHVANGDMLAGFVKKGRHKGVPYRGSSPTSSGLGWCSQLAPVTKSVAPPIHVVSRPTRSFSPFLPSVTGTDLTLRVWVT